MTEVAGFKAVRMQGDWWGSSEHNGIQPIRTCLSDPPCKLDFATIRFPTMPSNYASLINSLMKSESLLSNQSPKLHLRTQLAQGPSLHLMSFCEQQDRSYQCCNNERWKEDDEQIEWWEYLFGLRSQSHDTPESGT